MNAEAQLREPAPMAVPAPAGLELIRSLCAFHADVVQEIQSSQVEFEPGHEVLGQRVSAPVDWHQLARGSVRIGRSDLPRGFSPSGTERAVFCGPMHLVRRHRKRKQDEWIWLPVFLVHASVRREQHDLVFELSGEVELNLAWSEEVFASGEEDLLDDFFIRLGMLREEGDGQLAHVVQRNFGECWEALSRSVDEFDWVRRRELRMPAERADLGKERREGLHPEVLLFREQVSPYSRGLVQDLREIAKAPDADLAASALTCLLLPERSGVVHEPERGGSPILVEYSPLNPSQGDAVREAFSAPLTVIQGPPGTGKSTVVRSALLTLGAHGKTALFGSTNHKAVEAVVGTMNEREGGGSLVADVRTKEGKRWSGHLLAHLDTTREAEGFSLAGFCEEVAELEEGIAQRLLATRQLMEANDRMVELQLSRAQFEAEQAEWLDALTRLELPFGLDGVRALLETGAAPWWRQLTRRLQLWRKLWSLRWAWPDGVKPAWGRLRALLGGILDRSELLVLEAGLRNVPSLDEQADELVGLVEAKADVVESALGKLPAAWADGVREHGTAIAQLRREATATGRAGKARRESVERKYLTALLPGLPLWTITNLSVRTAIPAVAGAFDLAIIDEAGQCNPASVLPLLFRSKRALFVGDPQQLRPVGSLARSKEDLLRRKHGLSSVEFSRYAFSGRSAYDLAHDALLARGGHSFLLREHYRCHPAIAEFFNEHYYDGSLIVRTTGRHGLSEGAGISWTHVEGGSQTHGSSRWHEPQVAAIVAELVGLAKRGFDGTVGVVTPFREHAKRVRDRAFQAIGPAQAGRWQFICETADGFQGGERDLILFGLVGGGEGRSATPPFYLRERNRFNVAVSRAKYHLHVFGDEVWARDCGVPVLSDLLQASRQRSMRPDDSVRTELIGPVWEPRLAEGLRRAGIEFRQQYPAQGFYLDFAFFPPDGRKVNVEVDGESYHRDRNGNLRSEDVRRDLVLRADGWTVQRFWVYQLRDEWDLCMARIEELLASDH